MKKFLKKLAIKYLGLRESEKVFFALELKRVGQPHPLEAQMQTEISNLYERYRDVPMFFMSNLKLRWKENGEQTFLDIPEIVSLHGVISSNVFEGVEQ